MTVELDKLLRLVVDRDASDLHLIVGAPPVVRLYGDLRPLNLPPLTAEDTYAFMRSITPERYQRELKERGGADYGFAYEDRGRFRVSLYMQKGTIGLSLRLIPYKIRSFREIGLPEHVKNLLLRPRGLIAVTGPTGCGKTTTQATMIDFINSETDAHIVTIEDPIEYFHTHKKGIISQREVGIDVPDFPEALRRVLRMDPDVVLVGEMRDLPTMQAAITAAETGHLVLATLHTTGAARTINRVIDAFPVEQQEQVRAQLSVCLLAVISQVLVQRADRSGVVAAFEIMVVNPGIQHMIRENQTHKIISAIQTGAHQGMILLDDFLLNLFFDNKITYQTLIQHAQNPHDVEQRVKEYTYATEARRR